MAGLDPAIHAAPLDKCLPKMRKLFRMDARVKPGHDDDRDRNVRIGTLAVCCCAIHFWGANSALAPLIVVSAQEIPTRFNSMEILRKAIQTLFDPDRWKGLVEAFGDPAYALAAVI